MFYTSVLYVRVSLVAHSEASLCSVIRPRGSYLPERWRVSGEGEKDPYLQMSLANAHRAGAQRTDDVAHRMNPPSVTTLDHLLPPALKSGICIFIVSGKWPELARTVTIHYPLAAAVKECHCVLFVNNEPLRRMA